MSTYRSRVFVSNTPTQVYRDSISRIVVSQQSLAALARCRPFCNSKFRRYACQSPAGYYRSRDTMRFISIRGILGSQRLHARRCSPPANSRLPRPRECESVSESTMLRLRLHPGNAACEENARRDLNFKCGVHARYAHRNELYFLSAEFPFGRIYRLGLHAPREASAASNENPPSRFSTR